MIKYRTFRVVPSIPAPLEGLREIAMNYHWCWDKESIELFYRLDRDLWRETHQNPVLMLGRISQERLEELAQDDSYLAHIQRVLVRHVMYMQNKADWFKINHPDSKKIQVAYFSAEFGLAESLPIYSGGLGVLAGDHLKACSDLGVPLVAIGLAYRTGYFQQYLNPDGWQLERYPENDFYNLAAELVKDEKGEPVHIYVAFPDGECRAQIWRVMVGRVALHLLDTNIEENSPRMRSVTDQLYVSDRESRIRQEVLLGVGGIRALKALKYSPSVCHMNEGHSAFLALERIAVAMEEHGLSFEEAKCAVANGNVFTTHTPVPAGNEIFDNELVWRYCHGFASRLGLSKDDFLGMGRQNPKDQNEPFCMTVLALRCADYCNGVSKLHGKVSRGMWSRTWPELPDDETPIAAITNGIHSRTWISSDLCNLFDRYLGPRWQTEPWNKAVWERVKEIPDAELWRTHERRRERLVAFARRRLRQQLENKGAPRSEVKAAEEVLDPEAMTIGFARRFATYKRATLIFRDVERLLQILCHAERPVQILIAGKAHPADNLGKEMIRNIIHICRKEPFRSHVVFLENYDMEVARYLVQGADIWLNTPRRPLEASGTSGMKAAVNGALNLSVPDGWWEEGYNGENGFRIGLGESYDDFEVQNDVESRIIYDLLEKEVAPMFYERGRDGLPREWIRFMKSALASIAPEFSASRMVQDYSERFYVEAARRYETMTAGNYERCRNLIQWKNSVLKNWSRIKVLNIEAEIGAQCSVGVNVPVKVEIEIGDLDPDSLRVEVYYGVLDSEGRLTASTIMPLEKAGDKHGASCVYQGSIRTEKSGGYGYAVRVLPNHPDLSTHNMPGYIIWS
ncbi:alpha-glucan family phosphorylase [Candidatus Sumerlaeota bacterium]|nr:alpha-glucan family phosphorylase [Candidatus Sumerlaeota bacterium]